MTHYINGKWIEGEGKVFTSINPATQDLIWSGKEAIKNEIELAVQSARNAAQSWSSLEPERRISYLHKFIELVKNSKETLALILSQDNGKPLWEARMEIDAMIGKLAISIESFNERCGTRIKPIGSAHITTNTSQSRTRFKPHGVIAVYGPYNFPGHVPNGHIIPALIAGNTIVFKPSELTPYISEAIIKLWDEAGIPPGVINLIQGQIETGILLADAEDLNGIFFTGSSKTGKILHNKFGSQPNKVLALEMGGNNPLIAHDFKDLDAAIYQIIQSAFMSAGQRCTCARRLILIDSEQCKIILDRLIEISNQIKIGDPLDPSVFFGPVISKEQGRKILNQYHKLIQLGAKPLLEMKVLFESEAFLSPGILDTSNLEIPDEEIFGPLLQVKIVKDWDSAINSANQTSFGLSAGLISDNPNLYEDFYNRVEAGLINWNNQLTGASSSAPFGGIKDSGNHRPTAYHAADYCSYPISSLESPELKLPEKLSPGLSF